jgi:hypothetical protein
MLDNVMMKPPKTIAINNPMNINSIAIKELIDEL